MDKNLQKPGVTEKSLNKLFIIFLLFTFIVTAGSFILKYSITQRLDKLSSRLKVPVQEPEIGNILLDLNSAENDFQQASLYGHADKLASYKQKLNDVFGRIETVLEKYEADSVKQYAGSKQQIARSFDQKLKLSQNLFELKQQFDSLLNATTAASIDEAELNRSKIKNSTDTTVSVKHAGNNKNLFGRLKDAIANKNQGTVKILTIRREKQASENKASLSDLLKKLKQQNKYLLLSNEQLIGANLNLLTELHQLIQQLKDIDLAAWEKNRDEMLDQYQSTTVDMNSFIGVAVMLILVFIVLLIFYIRKAGEAEQNYILENERAVTLAMQKSEILAIMSHEIRNQLTAITGTIYMLNKTSLSADQEKKLDAINLSSGMLLETVNNILDISKLEQQPTEALVQLTFYPFKEITDAMEAIRFMAERKGLVLIADFAESDEIAVIGDKLRLKQVMFNLLSNAIKYTDEGQVTITAGADTSHEQKTVLKISITDTGAGIPKDEQAKLFTRYYQSNTNKKPGTGLGLYLCHQLIHLQGGNIQVESEAGKGCTFWFTIPYPKG